MSAALRLEGLAKTYANGFTALYPTDLEIRRGEIFALLGPNGAGKTTLISIVCGLVTASSGRVLVDGYDHVRDYRAARERIGLVPQELANELFESPWAAACHSRRLFGHRAEALAQWRAEGYVPRRLADQDAALGAALDAIGGGAFSPGEPDRYRALIDELLSADRWYVLADFAAYVAAQARVDALFAEPQAWTATAARNLAGMGRFSVDRAVREYVERVWRAPPGDGASDA